MINNQIDHKFAVERVESLTVIPFLLGLSSAFLGAVSNLTSRSLMRRVRPWDYIPVNFLLMAAMMLPGVPFLWQFEGGWRTLLILGGTVILDTLGNYLYFRAFEINNAATASALLSLSPLFTLLLTGVAALAPMPGWQTALAVLFIVSGIVVLQHEISAGDGVANLKNHGHPAQWLAPLGAALIFGATILPASYLFKQHLTNPYTYYFLRSLLIALLAQVFFRPNYHWLIRTLLPVTLGRAAVVLAQWLLLLYALQGGDPAMVKAVSDVSPLFVLLFGSLFLQEKITHRKAAGVLGIVIGLGLLAVMS